MPDFAEVHSKHYFLSVIGSDGQEYLNRCSINFPSDAFGHFLVKTDKPIYKPSQSGKLLRGIKQIIQNTIWICTCKKSICSSKLHFHCMQLNSVWPTLTKMQSHFSPV